MLDLTAKGRAVLHVYRKPDQAKRESVGPWSRGDGPGQRGPYRAVRRCPDAKIGCPARGDGRVDALYRQCRLGGRAVVGDRVIRHLEQLVAGPVSDPVASFLLSRKIAERDRLAGVDRILGLDPQPLGVVRIASTRSARPVAHHGGHVLGILRAVDDDPGGMRVRGVFHLLAEGHLDEVRVDDTGRRYGRPRPVSLRLGRNRREQRYSDRQDGHRQRTPLPGEGRYPTKLPERRISREKAHAVTSLGLWLYIHEALPGVEVHLE